VRRVAVVAGGLLLVALGIAAAVLVHRLHAGRDVHGSSTIEFVNTGTRPAAPRAPLAWPMFGYEPDRRAAAPVRLRPPFRRVWVAGGRALVEFPPAIAYGRLFYGTGGGRIYAVSARTGARAWTYDARRGIAASPAVGPYAHGTVYEALLNRFPSRAKDPGDGAVVALAAGTGRVRWVSRVGASETSPLLANGLIYVGGWNGVVYALDARTGRHMWAFRTGGAVKGGAAGGGTRIYVGSYDGHLYALDALTGRLVWRAASQPQLLGRGTFYSTPAVAYGRVYIGSTDGKVYSFGAASGKLRWSHHTGGYVYGSLAVWHETVLVGSYDHDFYAFDAASGTVGWRFRANGPISGSATVIDGVVYFATLRGRTYALDTRSGRLLWSFGEGKYAPAVADAERVYVVGYGTLYGFRPMLRSRR